MILVLLGTQDKPFHRMIEFVEQLVKEKIVSEDVFLQSGNTPFNSSKIKVVPFVDHNEMNRLIEQASFVITHSGVGSITSALKKGKKVIVIPRKFEHGEHVNDHQLEIAQYFYEEGYIQMCETYNELVHVICTLDKFAPNSFDQGNTKMVRLISEFINGKG